MEKFILMINENNYRNERGRCYCYYVNGVRGPRNKYVLMQGHRKAKFI